MVNEDDRHHAEKQCNRHVHGKFSQQVTVDKVFVGDHGAGEE